MPLPLFMAVEGAAGEPLGSVPAPNPANNFSASANILVNFNEPTPRPLPRTLKRARNDIYDAIPMPLVPSETPNRAP